MAYRYFIVEDDFPIREANHPAGTAVAEALRPDGVWVPFEDSCSLDAACRRPVDEAVALGWWQQPQRRNGVTGVGSVARCGYCGVRQDTYMTVHLITAPGPEGRCGFCTPQGLARVICTRRAARQAR